MNLTEFLKVNNFVNTINRYSLQIVHENDNTYHVEDMKHKRSMTRGRVVHIAKDLNELKRYLQNLRCA